MLLFVTIILLTVVLFKLMAIEKILSYERYVPSGDGYPSANQQACSYNSLQAGYNNYVQMAPNGSGAVLGGQCPPNTSMLPGGSGPNMARWM